MSTTYQPATLAAELYDLLVPDWPGEIDFYLSLARQAAERAQPVLEVGCGTGRVAIRLLKSGAQVTGSDVNTLMLDLARQEAPEARWVEADMRDMNLGTKFGLIIVPGHAFQFMLTPGEQLHALGCLSEHLLPDGLLVLHLDHQDMSWLGGLGSKPPGEFGPVREVKHPRTGHMIYKSNAWTYEAPTQTATVTVHWEARNKKGALVWSGDAEPLPLHCAFRFEVEHLLGRAGFALEALYGDFCGGALTSSSTDMLWLARKRA